MIDFVIVRENGAIISCGSLPDESIKHMTLNAGETLVRNISIGDPSLHYWDGVTAQPMPPRPPWLRSRSATTPHRRIRLSGMTASL